MKEHALTLLRIATTLFPPLASLIGKALETLTGQTEEEKNLADMVRQILPIDAPIHEAIRKLEKDP